MRRALVSGILVLAAGCRAPVPQEPHAGALRAVMSAYPHTLSLVGKSDTSSELVARLVTDSLFQYDADLQLRPRLASGWEFADDGKTLTIHLRRGVTWQDGSPVTARDVVFTVRKVRDPATEARSYISQFEDLVSIEAPDALTVVARYAKRYADVLDSWILPIIPEHLASKDKDLLTGEFARRPVGCGPFRFVSAEPGREIVLESNRDYWAGRPHLERLVLKILPDERTAYQALLRGDVDLLVVSPDVFREAASSPAAARLARFTFYRMNVWYIGWNQDGSNPFFTDPRVRRALVLALDRELFVSRVLDGLARPAVGSFHPDSAWTDRSIKPWPHDPVEAGRLLDEAGWKQRGTVRKRAGVPFSFTLMIPASTQEITDRVAAWVQQSLKTIGVEARVDKIEWKAFQERRRSHQFHAAMASLQLTPVPDQFELYHSSARDNGLNYGGLSDREVDRLLDEGRRTLDPVERRAVYDRLQARLHELEPISCLFHFASPVLADARLEGIEPSPLGLWNIWPGPRQWRWRVDRPGE